MLFLALLAAASSPALATDGATSNGFYLTAKATDSDDALAAYVNGNYVNSWHFGAGLNLPVLRPPSPDQPDTGSIFYYNKPEGEAGTFVTDGGLYPYSLTVPAEGERSDMAVLLPAGYAGSPIDVEGSDTTYLVNGLDDHGGSFLACNRTVSYFSRNLFVLMYAYDGEAAANCVTIDLELTCAALPPKPSSGPITHDAAQTLQCSA